MDFSRKREKSNPRSGGPITRPTKKKVIERAKSFSLRPVPNRQNVRNEALRKFSSFLLRRLNP
jgi:hypothetical protein